MKPVTVSITVPNQREEVYGFLDVLGNHEAFVDHILYDFDCEGPRTGVGARARAKVRAPGSNERAEIEVLEAERPRRIVEETLAAKGKRRTRGTYLLEEAEGGGTEISFRFDWLEAPRGERLISPLTRAFIRRANTKSMSRLAKLLAERRGPD
jgi:uncharacterized protein YndB with AHSA1/START domain